MNASKLVKLPKVIALLISLVMLALASTSVAIFSLLTEQYSHGRVLSGESHAAIYNSYQLSVPLAIISWVGFGVVLAYWRGSYGRSVWREAGLDENVYDLILDAIVK